MKIRIKVQRVETVNIDLTTGKTYTIESSGTGRRTVTGRVVGRDGGDLLVRNGGGKIVALPMAKIKSAELEYGRQFSTVQAAEAAEAAAMNGKKRPQRKAVRRATRKAINRRGVARV